MCVCVGGGGEGGNDPHPPPHPVSPAFLSDTLRLLYFFLKDHEIQISCTFSSTPIKNLARTPPSFYDALPFNNNSEQHHLHAKNNFLFIVQFVLVPTLLFGSYQ